MMKSATTCGLAIGPRKTGAASALTGAHLRARASYGKRLRQAFRGRVKGWPITSTPDGVQLLRPGGTGLCNLSTFVRAAPTAAPAPAPLRTVPERVGDWVAADALVRDREASVTALRCAAIAREELVQSIRSLGAFCESKDNQQQYLQGRRRYAWTALAIGLPGLFRRPAVPTVVNVLDRLLALHDLFSRAGCAEYSIDRLVGALSAQARIREFSNIPDKRALAVEGLGAMVDLMIDALKPGRNGTALNLLLGRDAGLDAAIRMIQAKITSDMMLELQTRARAPQDVPQADRAQARGEAQAWVERDLEIAKVRDQLRRALELAGKTHAIGRLDGVRVDSFFVNGLRKTMGSDFERVDLLVWHLQRLECERDTARHAVLCRLEKELRESFEEATLERQVRESEGDALTPDELSQLRAKETEWERAKQNREAVQRVLDSPLESIDDLRVRISSLQASLCRGWFGDSKQDSSSVDSSKQTWKELAHAKRELDSLQRLEALRSFARQGLSSTRDVAAALTTIHSVMGELIGRGGAERLLDPELQLARGAKDDDKARVLGDLLRRNVTQDRVAQLQGRLAALADVDATYVEHCEHLRAVGATLATFDEAQQHLRVFNEQRRGTVDLQHPSGLESCRKLKRAFELCDTISGWNEVLDHLDRSSLDELNRVKAAIEQAERDLQRVCRSLAGFDPQRLHTPTGSRQEFTQETLAALATDKVFRCAVGAVISLRTGSIQRARALQEAVACHAKVDDALRAREQRMGKEAAEVLRDTVRAAILLHLGKTPVHAFKPREHAVAIKATLTQWGVPIDKATPEIDLMLAQSFGPDEINLWLEQVTAAPKSNKESKARPSEQSAPSPVPSGTRASVLESIAELAVGSNVRLTMGSQLEVQTGSIPVEPTGTVTVGVKATAGDVSSLEIRRAGEGYELVFRKGWDAKAGVTASAGLLASDRTGLGISVTGSVEGVRTKVGGVALKFSNDTQGRDALKAVVDRLLSVRTIEAHDLAPAQQILFLRDDRQGIKAGVGAKAGFDHGHMHLRSAGSKYFGASAQLRATVSGAHQRTQQVFENTHGTLRKTETEISIELAGSASVGVRVGLPKPGSAHTLSVSGDVLDVGKSIAWSYKRRAKVMRDRNGLVLAGTEHSSLMYVPPGLGRTAADRLGGPQFTKLMQRLEGSTDPKHRKTAQAIVDLIGAAGPNDLFNVTCLLDERVKGFINDKLLQANALRARREDGEASRLEQQAQALLDDPDNYIVSKFSLIPTAETLRAHTWINLLLLAYRDVATSRGEFVAADVPIDPAIAQDVHDAALTSAK